MVTTWLDTFLGIDLLAFLARFPGVNLHAFLENLINQDARTWMAVLINSGIEGNWFYYIGPVFALLLVIFWKKKRIAFAIPALLIIILVMNPITKDLFEKVTGTGYFWRLLWIVPIIPLCAALPSLIEEKIKIQYLKGFAAVIFALIFVLLGSYTYDQRLCRFFVSTNEEKIEQPIEDIADTLLAYDDHPQVVADPWPSIFLRQYSPKIRLLFGRDIMGFGPTSELGIYVNDQMGNGFYENVASAMLDHGYEYLVTNDAYEGKPEGLVKAGFEFLTRIDTYGIYRIGEKTDHRTGNSRAKINE